MSEKTVVDPIAKEVLCYEVSDEAVEAAGMRTEIAGAWTFVCTGIQCNSVPNVNSDSRSARLTSQRANTSAAGRPDSPAAIRSAWVRSTRPAAPTAG